MLRIVIAIALLVSWTAFATEPRTPHTRQLEEGEPAPVAGLEVASWLAGRWQGEAFGSCFEEVWGQPSAGTMIGYFKLFDSNGVKFYELMLLSVVDGRLSLRVKHFSAAFESWEEKAEYTDFRLVEVEANALHFSGISFYKQGNDAIEAWIVMRRGDRVVEEKLVYRRVGTGQADLAPCAVSGIGR